MNNDMLFTGPSDRQFLFNLKVHHKENCAANQKLHCSIYKCNFKANSLRWYKDPFQYGRLPSNMVDYLPIWQITFQYGRLPSNMEDYLPIWQITLLFVVNIGQVASPRNNPEAVIRRCSVKRYSQKFRNIHRRNHLCQEPLI